MDGAITASQNHNWLTPPTERQVMKKAVLALMLLGATGASFAQRPYYGGGTHTTSHGGTYTGGQGGSSHKGGTYTSPTGSHQYGRHK
jgi:hypothetical protein